MNHRPRRHKAVTLKTVFAAKFLFFFATLAGLALAGNPVRHAVTKKPAVSKAQKPAAAKTVGTRAAVSRVGTHRVNTRYTSARSKVAVSTQARGRTAQRTRQAPLATSYHPTQQEPSAERYHQIQQSLADKGYYKGEPGSSWGPESAVALKRFQQDQNLPPSGKIDSLSVIALGLGPKRSATVDGQGPAIRQQPLNSPESKP